LVVAIQPRPTGTVLLFYFHPRQKQAVGVWHKRCGDTAGNAAAFCFFHRKDEPAPLTLAERLNPFNVELRPGNKRIDLQRLEGKGKSLWHKPAKCADAHTNSYDAIRPGRSRPFLYRPQQLPRYNAFVHDGNLPRAIADACPTANPPSFIGTKRGT